MRPRCASFDLSVSQPFLFWSPEVPAGDSGNFLPVTSRLKLERGWLRPRTSIAWERPKASSLGPGNRSEA